MPETPETVKTVEAPEESKGETPEESVMGEKENREELSDCTTMLISIITRGAYLMQLDQIRAMYILNEMIRTKLDGLIIDEIEEIIDDINLFIPCDFFYYLDENELAELLIDLGGLDVNNAAQYGKRAWDIFSDCITNYVTSTRKY